MSERLPCGCPSEYPDWRDADVDLGGHLVHDLGIPMLAHMPIGYENYLLKQKNDIERLELHEAWPGFHLTRTGAFRGRLLSMLEEERSPARLVRILPTPFHVRVRLFHGDVSEMRQEVRLMQSDILDEGLLPKELYLSYLTCPQCEEERGGKRLMILRRWVKSPKLKAKLDRKK